MKASPLWVERMMWALAGGVVGAIISTLAFLFGLDMLLGAFACEPEESVACGAAVGLLAVTLGVPSGGFVGGLTLGRLAHRLQREAVSA